MDRFGLCPLILGGWAVYGLIYLGFAFATNVWQIWGLFLGYAVFYALTVAGRKTFVVRPCLRPEQGAAFGWFNFAIGIAALPSSVIFGVIYDHWGPVLAFGWSMVLALIAAILILAVKPETWSR